jgi:integrase
MVSVSWAKSVKLMDLKSAESADLQSGGFSMPHMHFTEDSVKALTPPKAGQVDYSDPRYPSLILRVSYGDKRTWRVLHYRDKMPIRLAIGRWPNMKLKEAWEKARKFDPAAPRKPSANTNTFKDVAESFITRHVEANGLRSQYEIERVLKTYVYPKWEHRPFAPIKRSDVVALLDAIEDSNGARQADVVLAVIRKMMNWYATRNDDYASPIVRGMNRSSPGERKRTRVLSDDEIRLLWDVLDRGDNVTSIFGGLVKVLLLTGQREAKVARMKRSELLSTVDKCTVWHLTIEPREKNNPGTLRLPQLVLDIVNAQPKVAKNDYVFVGRGGGHFNSFSECKAELDATLTKAKSKRGKGANSAFAQPWVLHDLRRTAKTLMQRAGVRPDISERVLGHAIKGVEGVYDQHDYSAEKAAALQALADQVNSVLNTSGAANVNQRAVRTRPGRAL